MEANGGIRIMTKLSAAPEPLVLDVEGGESSGTTTITYEKEPYQVLWHRVNFAPWSRVSLLAPPDQGARAMRRGSFSSPLLGPGAVYQVRLFEGHHDPNAVAPDRFLAAVDVYCLRKRPRSTTLISDINEQVGGTFYRARAITQVPTCMQIVIGDRPPNRDADGLLGFDKVIGSAPPFPVFASDQAAQVTPLLPGHPHFAFIRVIDGFGNWQFLERQFTTLRRKTTARTAEVVIQNDGDPFATSDAQFEFDIIEAEALSIRTPSRTDRRSRSPTFTC